MRSKETKLVDTDPQRSNLIPVGPTILNGSATHEASDDGTPISSIWVYNVTDGTRKRLTQGYFNDADPVFDNKGDYIFFHSNRHFDSPQYEDFGTTFIYAGTDVDDGDALASRR